MKRTDSILLNFYRSRLPQKQKGGPLINPRGFMDGQPPEGSNWRIPGDTLYNPTPMEIHAVSDNGIEKTLKPFDKTQVVFPGAKYVDEYEMMYGGEKIPVRDVPTLAMGGLSANKAREILHHGEVHGHKLSDKQRRFFGAMSKGHTKNYQVGGLSLTSLPSNWGDRLSDVLSFPQRAITKLFTGKYQTPSEAMKIENPWGAMATDMLLDPLNLMGAGAVKTSGVYKNAYKLNPWRFKPNPEAYYRMIGQEGYADALESGLLRSNPGKGGLQTQQFDDVYFSMKHPWDGRNYGYVTKSGEPIGGVGYKGPYMAELTGQELNHPISSFPRANMAQSKVPISLENPGLKLYKQDWLRGYKQVKPPKKQDGGWLNEYDEAQDGKEITYTYDPAGSTSDRYMLKRTVTPYTSKRDIRRFTQAPINPNDVNFISNYGYTADDDENPNLTSVPFEGEKHWNIDRFIIEPHFSKISQDLQNADDDKKQMKRNVLADMYKYFMVQNQGDRKDAWKQAKQFMRKEINPKVKGPFYDQYLRRKDMPLPGLGMGITDAIRPEYMYDVNQMMKDAGTELADVHARIYAQNPTPLSKYKKFGMDWLMNYKGLSRKEAKDYLEKSKTLPKFIPSDAEPTYMIGLKYGGLMKQEGLNSKSKTTSQDGNKTPPNVNTKRVKREPIYVSDPNDPRLRAYQDSLNLYKKYYDPSFAEQAKKNNYNIVSYDEVGKRMKELGIPLPKPTKNKPYYIDPDGSFLNGNKPTEWVIYPQYKKPTQPIILQEEPKLERPIPIPRDTRDLGFGLPKPGAPSFPKLNEYNPDTPTKYSFTYPTGKYNEQKTMYFPSKSALKSFTEGVRGATYQEGSDYATATGNLKNGGGYGVFGYVPNRQLGGNALAMLRDYGGGISVPPLYKKY